MGQQIEVHYSLLGDVALFDTDRSLSGQDGESYTNSETAAGSGTFPGQVAAALLAEVSSIESVYVFSNTISVKRTGGWTTGGAEAAAAILRNALVYYESNRR